jgi:geranylgeranyl transferase type-1 subunit beta
MSKESTPSSSECDSSANNLKNDDSATIPKFLKKRHVKFLLRLLDVLPGSRFASLETSRMTMLFFVVSGLDVLGSLDKSINKDRRQELIEWIYSCQTQHGFVGSSFLKLGSDSVSYQKLNNSVHIAMTYTALATLAILGDDLSRINRSGISQGLKMLQKENGTFMASLEEDARDMRFVYCAASICRLLGIMSIFTLEFKAPRRVYILLCCCSFRKSH